MVGVLKNEKAILQKTYYDANNPGSYGGVSRLAKASGISEKTTKQWLMTQDTYTLHKPVFFKYKRRKVIALGIGELMQCDLIDMQKYSKYNKGIKYLLIGIDVFSKQAYAIPLKSKNADSLLAGFKKLFTLSKPPINLQTDEGKEFYNKKVGAYFKHLNINHYSSHSEYKASVVERLIRTLKSRLFRLFTHRNSYKYVDVLESILKSYNQSKHRTTGYAPAQITPDLESIIFKKIHGYNINVDYKFDIHDRVRISKTKRTFRKGYLPNWTDEIFAIYKRYPSNPPTYLLHDLKGVNVGGRFYEQELQKVEKSSHDFWRVEKILKTKGKGSKKEYFVKWKGFSNRFNSWVKSSWMKV